MNIFCVDNDPVIAATQVCDKHSIKMVTETSQMLVSALRRHNCPEHYLPLTKAGTVSKGGYHHHPSTRWAGDSSANFQWLLMHGKALCREYTKRYKREHFCEAGIHKMERYWLKYIPFGVKTPFAIAISEDMKCRQVPHFNTLSPVVQYRLYYKLDKSNIAKWVKRPESKPDWYDLSVEEIIKG